MRVVQTVQSRQAKADHLMLIVGPVDLDGGRARANTRLQQQAANEGANP